MARENFNAWQIANKQVGVMGQGLPDPTATENQVCVYFPAFDAIGFFPASSVFEARYWDWGFRGISVRDGGLLENVANSGTVTFDTDGVVISSAGTNSGEASISVKGWADGGELDLFDRMTDAIIAASWSDNVASGSGVGDGEWTVGQFDATSGILTNASTTKGWWVYSSCVAGTVTEYFCTSDGTSVTATDITSGSGPNYSADRVMYVQFTQGESGPTSMSLFRGIGIDNALATHTTNLPSGATSATDYPRFTATVKNGASDTQTRTITFRDVQLRSN